MKMKYGYKEIRKTSVSSLRKLCIDHNWFTRGTVEEYDLLLKYAFRGDEDNGITTDDLVEMATLISEHSSPESLEDYSYADIMYALSSACYSYFVEC